MKIIMTPWLGILLLALFSACTSPVSTVEPTNTPANDIPPPATLQIEGNSQDARLAAYCWDTQTAGTETGSACMDSVGFPTVYTPLSGTSPLTAQLTLVTNEPPDQLSASVFEASKPDAVEVKAGEYYIWGYKEGTNMELPPKIQQEITLDLAPGLYVFNVFAIWEKNGEASYAFLVEVK